MLAATVAVLSGLAWMAWSLSRRRPLPSWPRLAGLVLVRLPGVILAALTTAVLFFFLLAMITGNRV